MPRRMAPAAASAIAPLASKATGLRKASISADVVSNACAVRLGAENRDDRFRVSIEWPKR